MIINPGRDYPIVNGDKTASDRMQGWIESVTTLLNALDFASGNGSPEGVLKAPIKKIYYNNTGAPGTRVYIKTTDETLNTGWSVIA